MSDFISSYSPNSQPSLLSKTMMAKFFVDISCVDKIFQSPNKAQIPISFFPKTTEQDRNRGNVGVKSKVEEQSMAPFTILKFWENHFKLKKVLKQSDVNGSNRLLLPMDWVEKYILASIDPREAHLCQTSAGKQFLMLDVDDGLWHHLVLKKWKKSYFVLTGNWIPDFVKRKHLEAGDLVGIAFFNGLLFFKVLKKKYNYSS